MGRKKKVIEVTPLPEGFPMTGTFVRYYHEGWYYGKLVAVNGKIAKIEKPGRRDLPIPITDIEIPTKD